MHAGELPSAIGYHGLITVYGFFLPVATGSYGLFTVNHVYEACWSDRVQTGGQVERGIPIGIPTKNQNSSLNYKSINYQIDSNYPGSTKKDAYGRLFCAWHSGNHNASVAP